MAFGLAAIDILKLALGAVMEAGFGQLTEAAIEKLRQTIKDKFQREPKAAHSWASAEQGSAPDLDQAATYLQTFINEDPGFAQTIQRLVEEINASSQDSLNMNVRSNGNHANTRKSQL